MNLPSRTVIIEQIPEASNSKRERVFLRELTANLDQTIHPHVVLDCSRMKNADGAALHLLLCCLEEAMKRNGDARLAAVPERAQAAFRALGIDRLFRVYGTATEAAESFRRPPTFPTPMTPAAIAPHAANAPSTANATSANAA